MPSERKALGKLKRRGELRSYLDDIAEARSLLAIFAARVLSFFFPAGFGAGGRAAQRGAHALNASPPLCFRCAGRVEGR